MTAPTASEERAHDIADRGKSERPQREVDQVYAEVDDASASREGRIVEPRLVRAVRVMKRQVDGVDGSELSALHQVADALHAGRVTVRQIDAKEPVGRARRGNDASRFVRCARQRLLTEYGHAAL